MKYRAITGLMTLALLAGCSTQKVMVPDIPASDLYAEAQFSLEKGSWTEAIRQLEAIDSRYPFGAYSQQVQLDLIFAYYKSEDWALTLAAINRFVRLNPTHKKIDWVVYMRGLTHMSQDSSMMHDLFNVDRSDRDPEPVKAAFNDFKQLLQRYPSSIYAKDAQLRMLALKNRLANYDLATAEYYLRREAWISAINRCQELQKSYPDTVAARKALNIQLKAYEQLKLSKAAAHTKTLIELNPI
ncbi:outer membrane protein assembly factor BamD [Vibrio sp. RC27]